MKTPSCISVEWTCLSRSFRRGKKQAWDLQARSPISFATLRPPRLASRSFGCCSTRLWRRADSFQHKTLRPELVVTAPGFIDLRRPKAYSAITGEDLQMLVPPGTWGLLELLTRAAGAGSCARTRRIRAHLENEALRKDFSVVIRQLSQFSSQAALHRQQEMFHPPVRRRALHPLCRGSLSAGVGATPLRCPRGPGVVAPAAAPCWARCASPSWVGSRSVQAFAGPRSGSLEKEFGYLLCHKLPASFFSFRFVLWVS